MFRINFLHALLAAILSAIAAVIYTRIYFFATETDFSMVLGTERIIAYSLLICLLAAVLNYSLERFLKKRGEIIFNFLFSIISFAGVMVPISATLPLHVPLPELFPGLAVPMVFFPAIAWFTVNPLFTNRMKN